MSLSVEFIEDGRGVILHCAGHLTGQDLIESKRQLLGGDKDTVRRIVYWQVLLSDVNRFQVNATEIQELVSIDLKLAEFAPHASVAVIAPRTHDYGIARMWEILMENSKISWRTHIFKTREEADEWLTANTQFHSSAV